MKRRPVSLSTRLLTFFLAVMLAPLVFYLVYYLTVSRTTIDRRYAEVAQDAVEADAEFVASVIDGYKRKAHTIAATPALSRALTSGAGMEKDLLAEVYKTLFTVMDGDMYLAAAHVVSEDGSVRLSTHIFPSVYDPRVHSNLWDVGNIMAEARTTVGWQGGSLTYIGDHRITDESRQVFASVLRTVDGEDGARLGYVIIDIFTDAVAGNLAGSALFTDEILVDNLRYHAYSLVAPNTYGDFERFPALLDDNVDKVDTAFGQFSLVGVYDITLFGGVHKGMFIGFLLAILLGVLVALVMAFAFSRSIARRLDAMQKNMSYIEEGNLNIYVEETGIDDFDRLGKSFNNMVTRIIYLLQKQNEEREKVAEAERKALESQLNPHFMFNTLSTIKSLARLHGEDEIYTIAVQLGKLLRSALDNTSDSSTIQEGAALAESFLKIQEIRFPSRITHTCEIDGEVKDCLTPKLLIQTLVENSVKHGLGDGWIEIRVKASPAPGNRVRLTVSDNGQGSEITADDLRKLGKEGHVGLWNIYRRLELRWKRKLEFRIGTSPGGGFSVEMEFPAERREAKEDESDAI